MASATSPTATTDGGQRCLHDLIRVGAGSGTETDRGGPRIEGQIGLLARIRGIRCAAADVGPRTGTHEKHTGGLQRCQGGTEPVDLIQLGVIGPEVRSVRWSIGDTDPEPVERPEDVVQVPLWCCWQHQIVDAQVHPRSGFGSGEPVDQQEVDGIPRMQEAARARRDAGDDHQPAGGATDSVPAGGAAT